MYKRHISSIPLMGIGNIHAHPACLCVWHARRQVHLSARLLAERLSAVAQAGGQASNAQVDPCIFRIHQL